MNSYVSELRSVYECSILFVKLKVGGVDIDYFSAHLHRSNALKLNNDSRAIYIENKVYEVWYSYNHISAFLSANGRTFFSMCFLSHRNPVLKNRYIVCALLMTRCSTFRVDIALFDTSTDKVLSTFKSVGEISSEGYWSDVNLEISDALRNHIDSKFHESMCTAGFKFDPSRLLKVDIKRPSRPSKTQKKSSLEQVEESLKEWTLIIGEDFGPDEFTAGRAERSKFINEKKERQAKEKESALKVKRQQEEEKRAIKNMKKAAIQAKKSEKRLQRRKTKHDEEEEACVADYDEDNLYNDVAITDVAPHRQEMDRALFFNDDAQRQVAALSARILDMQKERDEGIVAKAKLAMLGELKEGMEAITKLTLLTEIRQEREEGIAARARLAMMSELREDLREGVSIYEKVRQQELEKQFQDEKRKAKEVESSRRWKHKCLKTELKMEVVKEKRNAEEMERAIELQIKLRKLL